MYRAIARLAAAAALVAGLSSAVPSSAVQVRAGDLLIASTYGGNRAVYVVDHTTLTMTWAAGFGLIRSPYGIAALLDGRILLADATSGVLVIDPATGAQSVFSSGGLLAGGTPYGVAVEPGGNALVSGLFPACGGPAVVRLSPDGTSQSILKVGPPLSFPVGLTVGPAGVVNVCDRTAGVVVRVALADGSVIGQIASPSFVNPMACGYSPQTGQLLVVQAGTMSSCINGGAFWVDPLTWVATTLELGTPCLPGVAIAPDGAVAYSGETVENRSITAGYVVWRGATFQGVAGPLTIAPEGATPTRQATWGRIKQIYR